MKKIGIIAPSGSIENFDGAHVKNFFKKQGIEAVIFPSCHKKFRYMAGFDKTRLEDLHSAFSDKSIECIICARGGYGALRLVDFIDYDLIKENEKPFVGFSDITILLIYLYKMAGLKTFHAKMAANGVLNMDENEFQNYIAEIKNNTFKTKLKGGILWGGNLASVVSLFGSKNYVPNEDIILFLEDINEPDYKIDKMLTQILRNKELSNKIKGVIFGEFTGAEHYIEEIKLEFASKLNVPYENNPLIGHNSKNIVLPFGKLF